MISRKGGRGLPVMQTMAQHPPTDAALEAETACQDGKSTRSSKVSMSSDVCFSFL
jgi:hypothetical protein